MLKKEILIITIVFFFIVSLESASSSTLKINFNKNMMDVYADDAALSSIASEVSRALDIKIFIDRTQENRKISVDFKGVPLEKGIKMIAYPLNYVIFRDAKGNATELLIFKTPGLNQGQYSVFAGKGGRTVGAVEKKTVGLDKDDGKTVVSGMNQGRSSMGKTDKDDGDTKDSHSVSEARINASLQGNERNTDNPDTVVLKGDRGFEVGMWVAKRMQEAENLRTQKQVEANSREYTKREMEPLTDAVNLAAIQQNKNMALSMAGVSQGGANESNTSAGAPEAQTITSYQSPSSYNNWSANMQSRYYQFTSQSRSYNYYSYYNKMSSTINYMRSFGK